MRLLHLKIHQRLRARMRLRGLFWSTRRIPPRSNRTKPQDFLHSELLPATRHSATGNCKSRHHRAARPTVASPHFNPTLSKRPSKSKWRRLFRQHRSKADMTACPLSSRCPALPLPAQPVDATHCSVKSLCRGFKLQGLAWPFVEPTRPLCSDRLASAPISRCPLESTVSAGRWCSCSEPRCHGLCGSQKCKRRCWSPT